MDASAYLRRQGWRGDGHSLDHTNRGIKKPLLVSKKVDVLGVGLNKHAAVSDQWWLKAFDQGLKNIGTGEESVLASVQKHGIKRGGLYGRFVKGEQIPGSLGQSLQASEESTSTGTVTPVEDAPHIASDMAVDIPPEDKLERVIGEHENQHHHDAMMHLLQNPKDAPASMKKMLDKKRKRAERPVEKRARRKTERREKSKASAEEHRQQAIEEGTWDVEKEEERKRMREINKRAEQFVLEAQKRGIIPLGPNEIRKGIVATGGNSAPVGGPSDEMKQVFDQAGLNTQVKYKGSGKNSLKAQKYAREKMKRELKRAAKAYLLGEKPPHEMTKEERRAKRAKKSEGTLQKKADAAKKEAERMASGEERAAKKRLSRAKRAEEKQEITRIIAEREAAEKAGQTLDEYYAERAEREAAAAANAAVHGNEFDQVADEINFGMDSRGGVKKIPGVGRVDRYPSKAEKKAKKLKAMSIREGVSEAEIQARLNAETQSKIDLERVKIDRFRAMKHGMSLEEYKAAAARGEVITPKVERKNIEPAKLAEYQERAKKKGITLEQYIRRREEKYAAKQGEKLGNPFQRDIFQAAKSRGDNIPAADEEPEPRLMENSMNGHHDADAEVGGFVIDTKGDDKLLPDFSERARAIISEGKPLAIVDTAGDSNYQYESNMPVPLDPRIWEGQKVKDLPKHIRKARRDWMAQRRDQRKAAALANSEQTEPKKSKGQRKVEARESFVKQILFESRRALKSGGMGTGMVTIEGVENVPLVKLESREGMFSKGEQSLARTVARRVLRNVKREEKAKMGKGKGWKKRERAAKEAARNAGISGFTTMARLEAGGKTNRDLLL